MFLFDELPIIYIIILRCSDNHDAITQDYICVGRSTLSEDASIEFNFSRFQPVNAIELVSKLRIFFFIFCNLRFLSLNICESSNIQMRIKIDFQISLDNAVEPISVFDDWRCVDITVDSESRRDNFSPSKRQSDAHVDRRKHRLQGADCHRGRHFGGQILQVSVGKIVSGAEKKCHWAYAVSIRWSEHVVNGNGKLKLQETMRESRGKRLLWDRHSFLKNRVVSCLVVDDKSQKQNKRFLKRTFFLLLFNFTEVQFWVWQKRRYRNTVGGRQKFYRRLVIKAGSKAPVPGQIFDEPRAKVFSSDDDSSLRRVQIFDGHDFILSEQ